MLGHDRREARRDERETFGRRGEATRYQMREKLLSIGDDSWIEDESGRRAFKVNGKALRLRKTLVIEDPQGNELAKIQDRPVRVRDVMEVEGADGSSLATVKKAMITPLRDRFSIDVAGGADLSAHGNIVDHEFEIEADGTKVAEVSKKWFRVRDTYGVEVAPGQNDALILAITVCIDQLASS
ncbi:MAG: LURP-one-related/scramblase family protein [Ornithinibacter sp.]